MGTRSSSYELYAATKKLSGKYQQVEKSIKGKQGNPLKTVEEQKYRELWKCWRMVKQQDQMEYQQKHSRRRFPTKALKVYITSTADILQSLFKKIWE